MALPELEHQEPPELVAVVRRRVVGVEVEKLCHRFGPEVRARSGRCGEERVVSELVELFVRLEPAAHRKAEAVFGLPDDLPRERMREGALEEVALLESSHLIV